MDNLAHALTGALIARTLPTRWAGEPARCSPEADFDPDAPRPGVWLTWSAVVAANLPDCEALVLWPPPLGDKAAYLLHHRGWSHSLVGIAAEAIAFAGLLWLLARWRRTARWFAGFTFRRGLTVAALGIGSHLFMDWWNSYGVRPFYPWDKTWYYGDLVFIVDPWVWLMLGGALVCGTRRFGRAKWWWYSLAFAATLVVAAACWKGQCPWWVLLGWCTGVAEIALLRWWGRWRAAPAIGGGTLAGYLLFAGWATASARGDAAVLGLDRSWSGGPRYAAGTDLTLAVVPVPAAPWVRRVFVHHRYGGGLSFYPCPRTGKERLEAWDVPIGLPHAVRGRTRFVAAACVPGELGTILDHPGFPPEGAVAAWRSFARVPVASLEDGRPPVLRLGDFRYAAGGDDWSALEVELPAAGPLGAVVEQRRRLIESRPF